MKLEVTMILFRVSLTAILFLAPLAPCQADPAPVIHYAPAENLEHIDVENASAHADRRANEFLLCGTAGGIWRQLINPAG
jgi:hypothetical protein